MRPYDQSPMNSARCIAGGKSLRVPNSIPVGDARPMFSVVGPQSGKYSGHLLVPRRQP
jgi:hypothetical protein